MPLPAKRHQIPIRPARPIRLPLQAPPRDLDVLADILDQRLLAHVIVFRPDEPQDQQVHVRGVEVGGEGVQDVDFLVERGGVRRGGMKGKGGEGRRGKGGDIRHSEPYSCRRGSSLWT